MKVHTRSQKLAQAAYRAVAARTDADYLAFAKKFPALLHTCGLAQAVSFAMAKKETPYVKDLATVLQAGGHPEASSAKALMEQAHNQPLTGYLRLSRDAIHAAGWLKRYAEAVEEGK